MFIRSKVVKGRTYYEVLESYRDKKTGRVRHRRQASLGTHPTIEEAFLEAERRYFATRRGRKRVFTDADRKPWLRVFNLGMLLPRGYQYSAAFVREDRKQQRFLRDKERERRQKIWDEFVGRSRGFRPTASCYAALGLKPGATAEEIRDARNRKARECHPDHGGTDEAMARINEAYEILMGQNRRPGPFDFAHQA